MGDFHSGAACCAFCFIVVIVLFMVIIILLQEANNYEYDNDGNYIGYSSGGRRGYGSGYGSHGGGWGRGGGWGCFSENTVVWTKNETQHDSNAKEILIQNLNEGNLVGTIEPSLNQKEKYLFTWTRATDVTIYQGNWTAHTFEFSNGSQLTATSPHLMIILVHEIKYSIRADNVKVDDQMIVNGKVTKVTAIISHKIQRKVAVETEDGTVQVNGVLATGICEINPQLINRIVKYELLINEYKSRHFGAEYDDMCMDSIAWKNNYLINNDNFK